jgi:hypothetical protein
VEFKYFGEPIVEINFVEFTAPPGNSSNAKTRHQEVVVENG